MAYGLRIFCCCALLACAGLRADTLLIEQIASVRPSAASRPQRGMTMEAVGTKWGEPAAKLAAVGQPPITRWEYSEFTVYFEYDHVIDAVARQP